MSEDNIIYTFYFKIVYTERIFYFSFNHNTTIKNFIENISNRINEIEPNYTIEVVETGQYDNNNGQDPELAPKIDYYNEYTLRDVYGNRWRNIAFYIRLIPIPENLNLP
jgi:hypothetical protein